MILGNPLTYLSQLRDGEWCSHLLGYTLIGVHEEMGAITWSGQKGSLLMTCDSCFGLRGPVLIGGNNISSWKFTHLKLGPERSWVGWHRLAKAKKLLMKPKGSFIHET